MGDPHASRPIEKHTGGETPMTNITDTARAFFESCETGQGWEVCQRFCEADATFSAQAMPLAEVRTLAGYCDWMKGLMQMIPDGHYELRGFAADAERSTVLAYAVFKGTHTGVGGPSPTGRSTSSDYVYSICFRDGRICHMTKIWNSGHAMAELGWA